MLLHMFMWYHINLYLLSGSGSFCMKMQESHSGACRFVDQVQFNREFGAKQIFQVYYLKLKSSADSLINDQF